MVKRGALIAACYILLFVVLHVAAVHSWLLSNPEWTSVQGIVQNTGLVTVPLAVLAWYSLTCRASPWCLRHGQHAVKGTAVKVCTHHHTREMHERVFLAHDRTSDPDKFTHGESHTL